MMKRPGLLAVVVLFSVGVPTILSGLLSAFVLSPLGIPLIVHFLVGIALGLTFGTMGSAYYLEKTDDMY